MKIEVTVEMWKARFVRIMTNIDNLANDRNPNMKGLGGSSRLSAIHSISSTVLKDRDFQPRKRR